jgi:hypothetical protein
MRSNAATVVFTLFILLAIFGPITAKGISASRVSQISYGAGGRLHGTVYGFNVWDELVVVSWASVTATQDGQVVDKAYSNDGSYEMYLPSGNFEIVVDAPGYFVVEKTVFIGDGSDYALDFVMERNNQPIPEFPIFAIQTITALSFVAALLFIRKRGFFSHKSPFS